MVTVEDMSPAVAVICISPALHGVKRPSAVMVPLLAVQTTARSVISLPFASYTLAVNCWVSSAVMVASAGVISRDAGAPGVTTTVTVTVKPSTEAVIVTSPALQGVKRPSLVIVPLLAVHVTAASDMMLPSLS